MSESRIYRDTVREMMRSYRGSLFQIDHKLSLRNFLAKLDIKAAQDFGGLSLQDLLNAATLSARSFGKTDSLYLNSNTLKQLTKLTK